MELIKFGSASLPIEYIEAKGYKITPNQVGEKGSYRDNNYILQRPYIYPNTPTKLTIQLIPGLTNDQIAEVLAMMDACVIEGREAEKAMQISVYNPETQEMEEGIYYKPAIEYTIAGLVDNTITFDAVKITLIEY